MRFKRGLSIYITSITLLSLNLYAINRDILIGVGAKAEEMGRGWGIAFNKWVPRSTFGIIPGLYYQKGLRYSNLGLVNYI